MLQGVLPQWPEEHGVAGQHGRPLPGGMQVGAADGCCFDLDEHLIAPDLRLVIVTSATWRGLSWAESGQQWYGILDLVVNDVLAAVTD